MQPQEIIQNNLPLEVENICQELGATPRLIAHLTLVHDVAVKIIVFIETSFPKLEINREEILFGAATHDIGKTVFKEELIGSGSKHEEIGVKLLGQFNVSEAKARFSYTHANWKDQENIKIEDLLVALADNCWKGKRNEALESLLTEKISIELRLESWEIFLILDEILQNICADADKRLNWQAQFSAEN